MKHQSREHRPGRGVRIAFLLLGAALVLLITLSPFEDRSAGRIADSSKSIAPDPMPSPPLIASGDVKGVVEVYVVGENGTPLEGVPVLFSASAGTVGGRAWTDSSGRAFTRFAPPRSKENLDVVLRAVVPSQDDSLFLARNEPPSAAAALSWETARIAMLRTAPADGSILGDGDLRQLSIAAVSRSETIVEPLRGTTPAAERLSALR